MTKTVAPQKSTEPTRNPLAAKLEAKHATVLEALRLIGDEVLKGVGFMDILPPHGLANHFEAGGPRPATDKEAATLKTQIFFDKGVDMRCSTEKLIDRQIESLLEQVRMQQCVIRAVVVMRKKGHLAELIDQLENNKATV